MKNKQPKIFKLNQQDAWMPHLKNLDLLMQRGNYQKAIEESVKLIPRYPDVVFFYTINSVANSMKGDFKNALKILKMAEKRFPDDYEVTYHLAKVYENIKEYDKSEIYYKKSYNNTPVKYKDARSDCLADLGVMYWELDKTEQAIEQWKLALKENPKNKTALRNLEISAKTYEAPELMNELMDDMISFQNIQIEKYFAETKKDNFNSLKEGENIIGLISETWNKKIAPEKEKLDRFSLEQKSKWFKEIEINFKTAGKQKSFKKKEQYKDLLSEEDFDKAIDYYNEKLDFLPIDSVLVLPFLSGLLKEAGLSKAHLDQIITLRKNPNDDEKEILLWACDVAECIMESVSEKNKKNKEILMEEALDIASEYVPKIKARNLLGEIEGLFSHINIQKIT